MSHHLIISSSHHLIDLDFQIETSVCQIMWSFYAHTVTVLISQLLSRSSCYNSTYKYRRVSFMIFPACRQEKCLRKQSSCQDVACTPRSYLCIKPKQTSTRRGHKNTKYRHNHTDLQERGVVRWGVPPAHERRPYTGA